MKDPRVPSPQRLSVLPKRDEAASAPTPLHTPHAFSAFPNAITRVKTNGLSLPDSMTNSNVISGFIIRRFMTKRMWFRRWKPSGLESSPRREPAINSLSIQRTAVCEHTNAGGVSAPRSLRDAVGLMYVDLEDFYTWTSHRLKVSRREKNDVLRWIGLHARTALRPSEETAALLSMSFWGCISNAPLCYRMPFLTPRRVFARPFSWCQGKCNTWRNVHTCLIF